MQFVVIEAVVRGMEKDAVRQLFSTQLIGQSLPPFNEKFYHGLKFLCRFSRGICT